MILNPVTRPVAVRCGMIITTAPVHSLRRIHRQTERSDSLREERILMTPFDYLFLALLLVVVLVNGVEFWRIRRRLAARDRGVRRWIQVWPPDEHG